MIRSLRLQNFKAIRDVEVSFERLTVFVGPNGSGKTSFLEGLQTIYQLGTQSADSALGGETGALRAYHQNAFPAAMEATCLTDKGDLSWIATPLTTANKVSKSTLNDWNIEILSKEANSDPMDWKNVYRDPEVIQRFNPSDMLRLESSILAKPSTGIYRNIASNGKGLASVLAYLQGSNPEVFEKIVSRFQKIVPTIERIRFERSELIQTKYRVVRIRDSDGNLIHKRVPFKETSDSEVQSFSETLLFDLNKSKNIPASFMSEGTLLALGLITVMSYGNRSDLVLLDDLDRGLHPLAQRKLINLIKDILDENPSLQIIATTHSPYLVDCLQAEEVRMTTLNEDGTVACGRLIDHPKFEKWKEEMAPGELWSMFGENWVSASPKTTEGI